MLNLGLILGLLGAIPVVAGAVYWLTDRHGELAGYWFQVTYSPDDEAMEKEIWSIELLELKQRGQRLRGTMWRRGWKFAMAEVLLGSSRVPLASATCRLGATGSANRR